MYFSRRMSDQLHTTPQYSANRGPHCLISQKVSRSDENNASASTQNPTAFLLDYLVTVGASTFNVDLHRKDSSLVTPGIWALCPVSLTVYYNTNIATKDSLEVCPRLHESAGGQKLSFC
jgi:hypothetical protein